MSSLLDSLGTVDWNATIPEERSNSELPDGKYSVIVASCVLKETKSTGKPMIAWDFVIMDGQYAGWHLFHNRVLDASRQESIKYARADFKTLGFDVNQPQDFEKACRFALDTLLEVQQKTNGEYVNVYINKSGGKASTVGTSTDFPKKEDFPF